MASESTAPDREQGSEEAAQEPGLWSVPGSSDAGPLELNQLIHERIRLGIVSALAVNESLTFTELRDLLNTSDGNLSAHARKLEDAGYVACTKSFVARVPRTEFSLTKRGVRELDRYLSHMEALIQATREA